MTTAQLGNAIAGRLRQSFIRDPSVAVEIETYRPFFVLGEVTYPGQYPYVPNMTVENAIAIAGGFTPRAFRARSPSPESCRACRRGPRCRCALRCGPATPSKSANAGSDFPPPGLGCVDRGRGSCALFVYRCSARSDCASLPAAAADKYPSRPIKFVVGFLAGGPNDTIARIFCDWLQPHLGAPCVVENKAGQGGMIAAK